MNSGAASSGSPLRAAVPPNRAEVGQQVQTDQTMQDLDGMKDELERTRKELDEMTKTMLSTEEDRDMWKRLFELQFNGPSCANMPNLQTRHESNRL